ncbi:MAG: hypothetical protein LBK65_09800 [Tannerellaceae bacterium]|nr:hypothetical protein [Tannerellaceae bacterium]
MEHPALALRRRAGVVYVLLIYPAAHLDALPAKSYDVKARRGKRQGLCAVCSPAGVYLTAAKVVDMEAFAGRHGRALQQTSRS